MVGLGGVGSFRGEFLDIFLFFYLVSCRLRAGVYSLLLGGKFKSIGRNLKWFGCKYIDVRGGVSFGDGCWVQAISRYKNYNYFPNLVLGQNVACSDNVHISCVKKIHIGDDTLIGSNVYIGDHSHGDAVAGSASRFLPPSDRELLGLGDIYIGSRVWICDGAVVLAGSYIASGSIVAANSVVRGCYKKASVIAGVPASVLRELI